MAIVSYLARQARSIDRGSTLRANTCAAGICRSHRNRTSTVVLRLSTPRYTWCHFALIEIYVSSTRHGVETARENRLQHFSNSGTISSDPSKDRRMRDLDAALGHHFDKIPIRLQNG